MEVRRDLYPRRVSPYSSSARIESYNWLFPEHPHTLLLEIYCRSRIITLFVGFPLKYSARTCKSCSGVPALVTRHAPRCALFNYLCDSNSVHRVTEGIARPTEIMSLKGITNLQQKRQLFRIKYKLLYSIQNYIFLSTLVTKSVAHNRFALNYDWPLCIPLHCRSMLRRQCAQNLPHYPRAPRHPLSLSITRLN